MYYDSLSSACMLVMQAARESGWRPSGQHPGWKLTWPCLNLHPVSVALQGLQTTNFFDFCSVLKATQTKALDAPGQNRKMNRIEGR
jgi:hypothetical protein